MLMDKLLNKSLKEAILLAKEAGYTLHIAEMNGEPFSIHPLLKKEKRLTVKVDEEIVTEVGIF